MKKYIKPELFYERYELAQHIADCQWELHFADGDTCVAYTDQDFWGYEDTLFIEKLGCVNTDWENYCYQPGAADDVIKVFQS